MLDDSPPSATKEMKKNGRTRYPNPMKNRYPKSLASEGVIKPYNVISRYEISKGRNRYQTTARTKTNIKP